MAFTYEFHYRPGIYWSHEERLSYQKEFRSLASLCFEEIPEYQVMKADPSELKNNIIVIARNEENEMVGFISAIILPIENISHVLHLGLTCVDPRVRGKSLTHKLTSKLVIYALMRFSFFKPIWITNLACVISSLANVSLHFENVYPSPFRRKKAKPEQLAILNYVNNHCRKLMCIDEKAVLNHETFVFMGSVEGSVFSKEANDSRFHHRNKKLNQYFTRLINFERGDELFQVAQVSLTTYPKYVWRKMRRNLNLSFWPAKNYNFIKKTLLDEITENSL